MNLLQFINKKYRIFRTFYNFQNLINWLSKTISYGLKNLVFGQVHIMGLLETNKRPKMHDFPRPKHHQHHEFQIKAPNCTSNYKPEIFKTSPQPSKSAYTHTKQNNNLRLHCGSQNRSNSASNQGFQVHNIYVHTKPKLVTLKFTVAVMTYQHNFTQDSS